MVWLVCYSMAASSNLLWEIDMWFLVAIMTLIHNGDEKVVYVWENPRFVSSEQCLDFVRNNSFDIFDHLKAEMPGDKLDRLLCVEKEKLRQFMIEGGAKTVPEGDNI